MLRRKSEVSVYKGRFHRTIGRVLKNGKPQPKKFLLGTDQVAAGIANKLLEKLWDEVVHEHKVAVRFLRELSGRLGDVNLLAGHVDYQHLRNVNNGPLWRAESLEIAEAIRSGQRQLRVRVGSDSGCPAAYVERITNLQRTYSVIAFVPESPDLFRSGQQHMKAEAQHLARETQELCSIARVPLRDIANT